MGFRLNVYHQKSSSVWLNVAIRKADFVELMHVSQRFAYCRKNKPCKFNASQKKNEAGRVFRLNKYCRCRIKSSNESPTELNHLIGLH